MANNDLQGAPPPLRKDTARNRQRLLEAARDSVVRGTPLQLNEVARAADVGVGTVYRHFPSVEALVESVVMPDFRKLLDGVRVPGGQSDPWTCLTAFLRKALQLQVENAGFAAVVASSSNVLPETLAVKAQLGSLFSKLLTEAIDARRIRTGIQVSDVSALLCGLVYSVHLTEETQRTRVLELYLGVLLAGIAAE